MIESVLFARDVAVGVREAIEALVGLVAVLGGVAAAVGVLVRSVLPEGVVKTQGWSY